MPTRFAALNSSNRNKDWLFMIMNSPDEHGPHGHSHVLSGRDQCTLCRFSRRDEQRDIVYPAVEGESVDQSGILRPPEEKAI